MAIIAISGHPGSGKSTLAEKLAKVLGYENINIGEIFKLMAKKSNCEIATFYKNLQHDPDMEKLIDQEQAELMLTKNNLIIQGRMAPFLSSSFQKINVLLKVNDVEGARRQMKRPENKDKTLEEVLKASRIRLKTETKRYKDLYGIKNHLDEKNFDIVINTTGLTEDQVFAIAYMDIKIAIK